ncbi:MAG: translocation/assembly module TamB, partial [Chitinophagaceae bacterium]|nr:translocation/assembly module TamB [Chitinophagaceae bacterium]
MNNDMDKQRRPLGVRIIKIMLKTVLFFLVFFVVLVLLVQTAPVQDFIREKAVTWLEKKLNTRVAVGKIYIDFPKDVVIENLYLEDRNKDTLLSGGKIKADITLFKLLSSQIEINEVYLESITAKVKRELPDTIFNFQFILDAFASKAAGNNTAKTDTANNITIKKITLNKIRLVYKDIITGHDVESAIDHFETKISLFDLAHSRFDVPSFKMDGFTAKVYQSKPLVKPEPVAKDMADAKKPIALQLNFKEVALEKINLDYRNDVSAFYVNLDLLKLLVHPDKLDLPNRLIDLNDFILQGTTASIRLGKTEQAKIVAKETKQEVKSQAESGWKVNVALLR